MATRSALAKDEADDLGRLFESAASYLSLLADPTRLRILHAICHDERSVNDIVENVGASQTNVSRNLALMYRAGMLRRRRDGNSVLYAVQDDAVVEICRAVCTRLTAAQQPPAAALKRAVVFEMPARRRAAGRGGHSS